MIKKTTILLLIITLFIQCKREKLIIANPGYTVGEISDYGYTPDPYIGFWYYVNGKFYGNSYHNGDNGWTVPSCSYCYNHLNKYMVQYDRNNPKTARFLFDYRVNSPADSIKYVTQFKTSPPSCCCIYYRTIYNLNL